MQRVEHLLGHIAGRLEEPGDCARVLGRDREVEVAVVARERRPAHGRRGEVDGHAAHQAELEPGREGRVGDTRRPRRGCPRRAGRRRDPGSTVRSRAQVGAHGETLTGSVDDRQRNGTPASGTRSGFQGVDFERPPASGSPSPYRRGMRDPVSIPPAAGAAILAWYGRHGRRLPFRATHDPYAVLVSEAMAQQTQAARAGEAWTRFMARFPTPASLAAATPADVLREWQGLGYNRRAINLQRAARRIVELHGGRVPADVRALEALPGVGPYTARAVAAIAFGQPVGAVDTNVRRVLGRIAASEPAAIPARELQRLADAVVPPGRAADWTHAVMDIGATVCRPRRPDCPTCPARPWCTLRGGRPGQGRRASRGASVSPGLSFDVALAPRPDRRPTSGGRRRGMDPDRGTDRRARPGSRQDRAWPRWPRRASSSSTHARRPPRTVTGPACRRAEHRTRPGRDPAAGRLRLTGHARIDAHPRAGTGRGGPVAG